MTHGDPVVKVPHSALDIDSLDSVTDLALVEPSARSTPIPCNVD